MLSLVLETPEGLARDLAGRIKALRLARGWTQQELAERAGLALPTYRLFERTGQISLARLIKVALILDAVEGFEALFRPARAQSMAELERQVTGTTRKRGRRRDEKA